ncbi:MAG: AmmeMemoRadiSam system protein A [Candidatus Micrarchaeota archaeon]|nr:AmmeMemoRadiSam system protein A [Candidatus Micrarchaeota archaeon]
MEPMFSPDERKELLELAREAIKARLEGRELNYQPTNPKFLEPGAAFVTLYKGGQERKLRGCIGHIEPVEPLWESVVHNAIAAAFYDPRFPPLRKEELPETTIEISVLSPKKEFKGTDQEFIEYLAQHKPGVVLDWGFTRSVFLPQVWEELPDPEQFLAHLSLKAGLHPLAWREAKKYTFTVEEFDDASLRH